jgi:glycine oxidase
MALSPTARADAVVLGAGLIGRLLACELAQRGWRVDLYDAGSAQAEGSAARVAAAMLAPLAESALAELPIVRMGLHGLQRWPQLLATLPAPVAFQQHGTLVVWHRQDAAEAQRLAALWARTAAALPALAPAQPLDAAALAAAEPALAGRFAQGLLLPDEGQLDNRALLDALLLALQAHAAAQRVRLHWHSPRTPQQAADEAGGARVFDCRGLGARAQWPQLRGVRGEVVRLHAPEVVLQRPTRLLHPRYPIYLAPKPGGIVVVGATEIESDDLSPASVRSALELLGAAYAVHPGFAEARIVELATQARPALPDNLPALAIDAGGVRINGLYRHGYLIAPALLDAVVEWAETGHLTLAQALGLPVQVGA